jgi:hypothetical protein
MHPSENPEDVMVTELKPVVPTHVLHTMTDVGGRHEEIEHGLLRGILKRNGLLDMLP